MQPPTPEQKKQSRQYQNKDNSHGRRRRAAQCSREPQGGDDKSKSAKLGVSECSGNDEPAGDGRHAGQVETPGLCPRGRGVAQGHEENRISLVGGRRAEKRLVRPHRNLATPVHSRAAAVTATAALSAGAESTKPAVSQFRTLLCFRATNCSTPRQSSRAGNEDKRVYVFPKGNTAGLRPSTRFACGKKPLPSGNGEQERR